MGLLGSSPFTLVGEPATDNLLPTGELTLDGPTGEAPAGIGVLDSAPIASGSQVGVDVGDVSPSVPVTVCGNGVGVLGDASASCGATSPAASNGGASAGASGSADVDGTPAGNQAEVTVDDVAANVPVMACGNSVGLLGDAAAICNSGTSSSPGTDPGSGTGTIIDVGTGTGTDPGVDIGVNTGTDTSTGGIIAPPPGTTSPGGTDGSDGPGSWTGTSGVPGTQGLTPGSGAADGSVTTFAPLRPSVAGTGSGALPSVGAAGDLLALVAFALLAAGALVVRATRPAAAPEGGDDR